MTSASEPALEVAVASVERVAQAVVAMELVRADGEDLPRWEPGAHVDLRLRDDLVRQYSLCGDPADRTRLRVAVLREPAGRGGSALVHDELRVGSRIRLGGPRNHFAFEPEGLSTFIAGGIGITPLVTMIARACEVGAPWRLLYGGRTRASMAFAEELLDRHGPERVVLHPEDEAGLLPLDAWLDPLDPGGRTWACGPPALLQAVERRCRRWPEGALRVERFSAREPEVTGSQFEVVVASTGAQYTVSEGQSVLDVLEGAGVAVLASCREGTCGTCETGVLEGGIDHRDAVLTPAERATNDVMMICCSRASGSRLVLDL